TFRADRKHKLELSLKGRQLDGGDVENRIFLAIPARGNGTEAGDHDLRRFESDSGQPVVDQNTGEGEMRIPRLAPALRLHLGRPAALYTSMPLAEMRLEKNVLVRGEYTPPVLAVHDELRLSELCRDLSTLLRRKAQFLSGTIIAAEYEDKLMVEMQATLRQLVAGLPAFEAQLATRSAHPFALYLSLNQMLGHLAALSKSMVPPLQPPYDHEDPLGSFLPIIEYLRDIVE